MVYGSISKNGAGNIMAIIAQAALQHKLVSKLFEIII